MKVKNLILVFALFLTAYATETKYQFASFAEVQDISATSYGKSLLDTISLQLKAGGDISTIQKLLSQLLNKLRSDQKKADTNWAKTKKRLTTEIGKLKIKIDGYSKKITTLRGQRQALKDKIKLVIRNLTQYRLQAGVNTAELKSINKKRTKDINDFRASRRNHMAICNAIDQVVRELRRLIGSISGRGKPADVKAISQETRDAAYAKLKKAFVQITKDEEETQLFIQMATQADQRALEKLIRLLLKLRGSCQKSYNSDVRAENKSKSTYRKLEKNLLSDNRKLGRMIFTSNTNLKKYRIEVGKLTGRIGVLVGLRGDAIKIRNAKITERKIKGQQYDKEKKQRLAEIAVILKLQDIVKRRLANMSQFLRSNTGA